MLNQKDNDFDDLFRRASEKYPLRTDSAEWDRMAAALDNPPSNLPDEILETDKRRRRRLAWFFLLLPLAGIGYWAVHRSSSSSQPAASTVVRAAGAASSGSGAVGSSGNVKVGSENGSVVSGSVAGGSDGSVALGDAGNGATTGGGVNGGGAGNVGASGNLRDVRTNGGNAAGSGNGSVVKGDGKDGSHAGSATSGMGKDKFDAVTRKIGNVGKSGKKNGGNGDLADAYVNGKRKKNGAGGKVVNAGKVNDGGQVSGGKGNRDGLNQNGVNGGSGDLADAYVNGKRKKNGDGLTGGGMNAGNNSRVVDYSVGRIPMKNDYRLTVNVEAPNVNKAPVVTDVMVVKGDSNMAKAKTSLKKKSSYLYVGLMAAPDISSVKLQKMDGVGTTFSFLLGYQFNKKWAIETGVSVDKKKYYSDGEYFETKNLNYWRQDWALNSVDGTCYMWELPVNVRYNLSQGDKTSWFLTAGLSTYFMTREKYNYYAHNTTTGNQWDSSWDIPKSKNYWFSIINLSAGYEHRIGAIGNLRIEPYLRIPTSGLGTGKLSILSTGINIGITRRLW